MARVGHCFRKGRLHQGLRLPLILLTGGSGESVGLMWLLLLGIIVCGNQGSEIIAVAKGSSAPGAAALIGNGNGNGHGSGKPEIESYGNVTVLAGQRGELKCRVKNLANYTVLWLRHRDTHLLSAGADAYIADSRFRAFQGPGNTWGLRISATRPFDGGVYECQISTTPPISASTYLTVVEPITSIEGLNGRGSELFIKAGSTINLTCIVEDATENAPKHILWRHNNRVVNFEWQRGGLNLVTEKKKKGVTVSRLLIQKAVRSDSGIYLCAPQNAHPAQVKIHVLEQGENQAAMQSKANPVSYKSQTSLFPLTFCVLFQFVHVMSYEIASSLTSPTTSSDTASKFIKLASKKTTVNIVLSKTAETFNVITKMIKVVSLKLSQFLVVNDILVFLGRTSSIVLLVFIFPVVVLLFSLRSYEQYVAT